jgi:hypothetical protein
LRSPIIRLNPSIRSKVLILIAVVVSWKTPLPGNLFNLQLFSMSIAFQCDPTQLPYPDRLQIPHVTWEGNVLSRTYKQVSKLNTVKIV